MEIQKKVLFWIGTLVVLVAIFATPVVALASTTRMNSNAPIYPMAVSPPLGVASSFAVLAATLISDAGGSAIIGDVGLSPGSGAAIGLLCTQVTGTVYDVDAAFTGGTCLVTNAFLLGNAQTDVSNAFSALSTGANAACTTDYGAIIQDLAGFTLVPGVYCANSFRLSGPLLLDDTGAPNGVWIFRTASGGDLSTTAGGVASVQFLTGVASPCNVWWKVVSGATLGSGTTFIGNIIAYTSISLGVGATLDGRALAQTAAVTMLGGNSVTLCTTPSPSNTGLSIFKFNDLNGNRVYEPGLGETPLSGRQVTITGPGGYSSDNITDGAGSISLTGLVPGPYIVTEIVPSGWTVITPNPQTAIVSADNVTTVNFAEQQLGPRPPGLPGPTVGGTVMPVDKGGLLIPWLGMAGLLLLATGAGLFIRRRIRR
jgi:hypothetical protein